MVALNANVRGAMNQYQPELHALHVVWLHKKSLSKMEMQNMVCFRYRDIGHFAKHCPLKRLRPTRVNTISKATPTKRTTVITCGKGKKTQIIANKGIKHSKVRII